MNKIKLYGKCNKCNINKYNYNFKKVFSLFFLLLSFLFSFSLSNVFFATNNLIQAESAVALFSSESTRNHLANYIHIYTEFNSENNIFRRIRILYKNSDVSALTETSLKRFYTNSLPENGQINIKDVPENDGKNIEIIFTADSLDDLENKTRKILWDDNYTILFQNNENEIKQFQENYNLNYLMGDKNGNNSFDQKIVFPENTKIDLVDVSSRASVSTEEDNRVSVYLPGKDNIAALFNVSMPFRFKSMEINTFFDDNKVLTRRIRFVTESSTYEDAVKVLDSLYGQLNIHSYEIVDENKNPYAVEYEFSSDKSDDFYNKNALFFKDNLTAFEFRQKNFFQYIFNFKESFTATELPFSLPEEIIYKIYSLRNSSIGILDSNETESSQFKGLISKDEYTIKISANDYKENIGNELFIASVKFKRNLWNKWILPSILLVIVILSLYLLFVYLKSRKLKYVDSLNPSLLFVKTLRDKENSIQRNMNSSIPGLSCWQLDTSDGKISNYTIKAGEDGKIEQIDLEHAFKWVKESLNLMNIQRYLFYSFSNPQNLEQPRVDYLQVGVYQNKSIDAQFQLQMMIDGEIIALTYEKRFALKKEKEILSILSYAIQNDALPNYCEDWELMINSNKENSDYSVDMDKSSSLNIGSNGSTSIIEDEDIYTDENNNGFLSGFIDDEK